MKFSVSSITKPASKLVNKRNLIIAGAVLVLLVLFVVGMVNQVRAARIEKAQAVSQAAELADLRDENKNLKTQVSKLQTAAQFQTARSEAVCSWVKGVVPRYRIAVPPLCQ